jgi:hypothetical protein
VTIEEARRLAQSYVDSYFGSQPVVVFPVEAAEDYGWCYMFYYNTKRYMETDDPQYALDPGPGPVVVVKGSGDVWMLGSTSWEEDLAAYAQHHGLA